jgi:hypothetical protein
MLVMLTFQTASTPLLELYDHLQHLLEVKMPQIPFRAFYHQVHSSTHLQHTVGLRKCRAMNLYLLQKETSGWGTLEMSLGFLLCLL